MVEIETELEREIVSEFIPAVSEHGVNRMVVAIRELRNLFLARADIRKRLSKEELFSNVLSSYLKQVAPIANTKDFGNVGEFIPWLLEFLISARSIENMSDEKPSEVANTTWLKEREADFKKLKTFINITEELLLLQSNFESQNHSNFVQYFSSPLDKELKALIAECQVRVREKVFQLTPQKGKTGPKKSDVFSGIVACGDIVMRRRLNSLGASLEIRPLDNLDGTGSSKIFEKEPKNGFSQTTVEKILANGFYLAGVSRYRETTIRKILSLLGEFIDEVIEIENKYDSTL